MEQSRFNLHKSLSFKQRALRNISKSGDSASAGFLHIAAAEILGERLAVTNREFNQPVILFDNPFSTVIEETVMAQNPPVKGRFRHIITPDPVDEILDLEPNSIDLALSVFDLHRVNDLPKILLQINLALKPDGLFVAVLPTEGTLVELSNAIMKAELAISGGAGLRVDLFPQIRQLGDLLVKTGFKLPVVDMQEQIIRYKHVENLIKDLRNAGASSCTSIKQPALSKPVLLKMKETLNSDNRDDDGKLRTSFNLGFLSGWKDDPSQQKPLKPGSAKNKLTDFLN